MLRSNHRTDFSLNYKREQDMEDGKIDYYGETNHSTYDSCAILKLRRYRMVDRKRW